MATYERRGYCPENYLRFYEVLNTAQTSKLWSETRKILGDRTNYMLYSDDGIVTGAYIGEVLAAGNGELGLEIAKLLETLIPVCVRYEIGRRIIITEYPNLDKVHESLYFRDGKWVVKNPKTYLFRKGQAEVFCFEDERFLVSIFNTKAKVYMHIYKK